MITPKDFLKSKTIAKQQKQEKVRTTNEKTKIGKDFCFISSCFASICIPNLADASFFIFLFSFLFLGSFSFKVSLLLLLQYQVEVE